MRFGGVLWVCARAFACACVWLWKHACCEFGVTAEAERELSEASKRDETALKGKSKGHVGRNGSRRVVLVMQDGEDIECDAVLCTVCGMWFSRHACVCHCCADCSLITCLRYIFDVGSAL